jgi:hypothetical protein
MKIFSQNFFQGLQRDIKMDHPLQEKQKFFPKFFWTDLNK